MELSNFDIELVLRGSHPDVDRVFKQVISKDVLPFHIDEDQALPISIVVNTHFSPGKHWFCIIFEENCTIVIEPYGIPISWFNFIFLQRNRNLPVIQNTMQLQKIGSPVCGYYAIYFIYYLSKGYSLTPGLVHSKDTSILQFFKSDNQDFNDNFVVEWVRLLIRRRKLRIKI